MSSDVTPDLDPTRAPPVVTVLTPEEVAAEKVAARNAQRLEQVRTIGFGRPGGADPREAAAKGRPWSIQHAMRGLLAEEVEANDANAFELKGRVSRAKRLAMKNLKKADEGDSQAMAIALDRADGKVAQPISGDPENPLVMLHAPVTDDERAAIIAGASERLAVIFDQIRNGVDGTGEEVASHMATVPGATAASL